MHAGKAKNGSGQRAKGGKIPAGSVEAPGPAEKQNKKCTPARRRTAAASVHTETNSSTPPSKQPCRRRNRIKMHAGEASKGSGQRAKGGKFLAATVKTITPTSSLPNICRSRKIPFPTALFPIGKSQTSTKKRVSPKS
ncbi:MAG: hypothetical protein ACLR23_06330 [Clostridia bacterium]